MKADIYIENLKCGGCANTIKKELMNLSEVVNVEVAVENSLVSVVLESDILGIVKDRLAKLGYPEQGAKNTIVHKAKSFVSCATGRLNS
ncbi:heavy-metal-associated domain-containing protein [Tenacibaculum maritimum]|uniref:heavy-metal-associated domain-containing protein n=1 Tax=Tenacibaculum maritimum TaxID=107401 RepID=UPI0012E41939|nr:heavy-metal-associated domain-containing protein [Tenacibaculum maritimum]CAA0164697.1 conserved hypothetical protein [Tenacibaculum maritimum]